MRNLLFMTLACLMMQSCDNGNGSQSVTELDNVEVKCRNLQYSKALNFNDEMLKEDGDILRITAGEQTDLFCDPKGIATNTTAPVLLTPVDNTKPFTFTAKVEPQFTETGTYSAGAIMAYVDKMHWQKLSFEQDEDGNHRIVTVRTIETSDDNNHERVDSAAVYLRFSSDTQVIGSYYSEDGKNWHLVRIYKNEFPDELYLSISAQSPKDKSHTCLFSETTLEYRPVANFRKGNF